MKFKILITALVLFTSLSSFAQSGEKIIYPIVVSFESICCGVPSDSVVRSFVKNFKKKYKVKKIAAYHIGPMGREGEYYLAFKLNELNKKQAGNFISRIQKLQKLSTDQGILSFKEKFELAPGALPSRAVTEKIPL